MSKTTANYGPFGGRYVAETLMPALEELERAFEQAQSDPAFQAADRSDERHVGQCGSARVTDRAFCETQ
jgi:tryptophan synthase beta subunit